MIYRMFKITCKAQTEQSTLIYSLHIWAPLCFILDSLLLFGLFFFVFVFVFPVNHLESYVQFYVQNLPKNPKPPSKILLFQVRNLCIYIHKIK